MSLRTEPVMPTLPELTDGWKWEVIRDWHHAHEFQLLLRINDEKGAELMSRSVDASNAASEFAVVNLVATAAKGLLADLSRETLIENVVNRDWNQK